MHERAGRQKFLTCGLPLVSPVRNRRIEAAMIAAVAMHAVRRARPHRMIDRGRDREKRKKKGHREREGNKKVCAGKHK